MTFARPVLAKAQCLSVIFSLHFPLHSTCAHVNVCLPLLELLYFLWFLVGVLEDFGV